ncbi:MAG TPA: sigma-54 dependent transcriptional regulator [Longimicrobium sp.]|nr:sigma-54 dependent transcriptional regulator [Longimicrobium sp.]
MRVVTGPGAQNPTEHAIKNLRQSQALLNLVGLAPTFVRAIASIPAMARGDAAVVISGETGTGKELVARALHYAGPRAPYPFVPVNCGSLTDTLLEDELFGHERGAFTDARTSRSGLLLHAERGTLFLDEVDSMTPRAQVALLRVLQEKTFRVLGSSHERRVDVRFIAASNTPLLSLVQRGLFRSDLYYRLAVLTVDLPPLRHRPEDVLVLARHFLAKHAPGAGHALSAAAERALLAHDWPGNVRELENRMLRAQTLCAGERIAPDDLGLSASTEEVFPLPSASTSATDPQPLESAAFQEAKRAAVDAFEREYLTRLLRAHGGNVSSAARTAGKERNDLRRLLKKHRLDPLRFAAFGAAAGGEEIPHPGE